MAILLSAAVPAPVAPPPSEPPPAAPTPQSVIVGSGYLPQDKDERGLWMQADEDERELKRSSFVINDPALNAYVRRVFCNTVGSMACADVRIYVLRTAYFNASMAPNGMMLVYSGLFLRTRNEAQLAAVLGHEFTHYRNRHSLMQFREIKKKTNVASVFSIFGLAGSLVQLALISSIFSFTRSQEAEADAGSIPMMARAGYDTAEASRVWEQLRAEMDATAVARRQKSRKDRDHGLFETHPPTAERSAALRALALQQPGPENRTNGRGAYSAALLPWWPAFVDDQIKLNDFGATDYLLSALGSEGWTAELLYARGELYRARGQAADLPAAAGFYRQAVALDGAPPEAWRGLGLALTRQGQATEGRDALARYLAAKPDAKDAAMIATMIGTAGGAGTTMQTGAGR